jgi:hypothetical protein
VSTEEVVTRNVQALADSLGKNRVLEEELGRLQGELCQLRGATQLVVMGILGLRPDLGLSMLATNLSIILGEVSGLITDGVFHGASRWSSDQICELGHSLEPIAMVIAEMVTVEWVKEAHQVEREATLVEGGVQATEAGSSAAPTMPSPNKGTSLVEPAMRPFPSLSSGDVDRPP